MASAAPDPDPQPPARPTLFALPSDLEVIELLRLWKEGGAAAVPSWIHPAEVYGHSPSDLIVAHQPASAADGTAAWFLVTTVRHLGPKDQRIRRVVTGGGTWKGEHSHPLVSLPDRVHLGSVRSLTYMVKAEDGKDSRTGHLMREYLLSGGAGLVAGSTGLETALCVIYFTPRDAEVAAAKSLEKAAAKTLEKAAAKARRDAAKAAKAQEKEADKARRAEQKDARRAAAKARRRASSKGQELAAVNAAAAAAAAAMAVDADAPPRLALVAAAPPPPAPGSATPPPRSPGSSTPPPLSPGSSTPPRAAASSTPPPRAAASATPPRRAPASAPSSPISAAPTPALEASTLPPSHQLMPSPSRSVKAQTVPSASSPPKRTLLLEVGADSFPIPGSCLSWKQVYEARQVEGQPPFKKAKRVDCSGWYLLDARHKENLGGSPCTTA